MCVHSPPQPSPAPPTHRAPLTPSTPLPTPNDDGSSYYNTTSNFFVYGGGGLKVRGRWLGVRAPGCALASHAPEPPPQNDFEGHDNWWSDNVIAYCGLLLHNGYGGTVGTPGRGILDGHEQKFIDNKALVGYSGSYAKPLCTGTRGATVMSGTQLWNPNGNATTDCGKTFDVGAVVKTTDVGTPDLFISLARAVLWVG